MTLAAHEITRDVARYRLQQLLCGPVDVTTLPMAPDSEDFVATSELAALKAQQSALRAEVTELRTLVERLYAELGVTRG